MLYPYRMVGHFSAWRHRAPWLKGQLPARVMGRLSAVSVLPSTHSSVLAPAERGSHPALPEGRPPLVRCRYRTGGSSLGFRSKLAKGWLQISPPNPDIASVKFIPVKKGCICKRLQCLQHKVTALDFYGKSSIGQCYIKRHLDSHLKE